MNRIDNRRVKRLFSYVLLIGYVLFWWNCSLADARKKDPELRIAAFLVSKRLFIDAGFDKMIAYQRGEAIGYIQTHDLYQEILRESSIHARADEIYMEKYFYNESMGILPGFGESPSAARDTYLNERLGGLAGNPTAKLNAQQVAEIMIGFYAKQLNKLRSDLRSKDSYQGYRYLIDPYFPEIWQEPKTIQVLLLMGVDPLWPEKMIYFTEAEYELQEKVSPKLFSEANKLNEQDPDRARCLYRAVTWFTLESDPIHQKALEHFAHIDKAEEEREKAAIVNANLRGADRARAEKDFIAEKWWLDRLLSKVPDNAEAQQRLKQCEQDISDTSAEEWIQLSIKYYKEGRYRQAAKRLNPALAMKGDHQPRAQALWKKINRALRFGTAPTLDDILSRSEIPEKNRENVAAKQEGAHLSKPEEGKKVTDDLQTYAEGYAGTWVGTFQCNYGVTDFTLEIKNDKWNYLDAILTFHPDASNQPDKEGVLNLKGRANKNGSFLLQPKKWIKKLKGHRKVGMKGKINRESKTLEGDISGRKCSTFQLTKQL